MQRARLIAVLLVVGATIAVAVWWMRRDEVVPELAPVSEQERAIRGAVLHRVSAETVQEVLRIEAQEKQVAETVWAKEMLAQECGRVFERLWDDDPRLSNFWWKERLLLLA